MHDLAFELKPSKCYLILLGIVVLITFLIIYSLPIGKWSQLVLNLLISVYAGYQFWRHGLLKGQRAVIFIEQTTQGKWQLYTQNNMMSGAQLSSKSTMTQWVSIVCFKVPYRYRLVSCLIFWDSLAPGDYRKLLVTLKTDGVSV